MAKYGDINLHFIHQRSKNETAVPVLITHGWPGSVFEFHKVIGPLTDPERFGGCAEDAFHVVCPSIPGFGFSSAPTQPGFETRAASRLFMQLMDDLGYDRYFLQGGDLGAGISLKMGRLAQERIAGIHLNMPLVFSPRDDPMRGVSQEEIDLMEKMGDPDGGGYASIQSTKPQTLGYGLHNSPVGIAGWIVEKFHGWTDHDGNHEDAVSREEILTNISIYWYTGTATSSARYYYECAHFDETSVVEPPTIPAPVAYALFPGELMHPPRAWAERQFNVARWSKMERGGHFAALEVPDLLVQDIRASFRPLR
jgi:microsomal epoxide hydrolase